MQTVRKVFTDQKLDIEDFQDFLISAHEFLNKFGSTLTIEQTQKQIELTISVLPKLFTRDKREYLQSIIDFLDGFDKKMELEELQEHLQDAICNLKESKCKQ